MINKRPSKSCTVHLPNCKHHQPLFISMIEKFNTLSAICILTQIPYSDIHILVTSYNHTGKKKKAANEI